MKFILVILLFAASALAAPLGFQQPDTLRYGLVGWFTFNEGTGTNAFDSSGFGNTAILTNAPVWTNGLIGNALKFASNNGAPAFVQCPGSTRMSLSNSGTIVFWVKPNLPATGYYECLVANRNFGDGINCNYEIFLNSASRQLGFYNSNLLTTAYSPPANQWTHIATVITASGTAFYTNGQFYTNITATPGFGFFACTNFTIGFFQGIPVDSQQANVSIDDARIYNRAITAAEIQRLYNNGYGQ